MTVFLAGLVGIGAGLISLLMNWLVGFLNRHAFFGIGTGSVPAGWRPALVAVPAVVFLAVAYGLRHWCPEAAGPGIGRVMSAVGRRGGFIRSRVIAVKAAATSLCIGAGGPFGLEGPVVHTGAAVGSLAGRHFRMGVANIRVLAAAGAAGALAARYGAAIGGAVFSAELLLGSAGGAALIPLIVASFLAVLTRHLILGGAPEFAVPALGSFALNDYVLFGLLGVVSGLAAVYFIKLVYGAADAVRGVLRTWWAGAVFAGLLVGFVGITRPEVLGTGHRTIQGLLAGDDVAIRLLVFFVLLKPFLCAVGLSGGVSGGVFAPALFTGACLGMLFARVCADIPWLAGTAAPPIYCLVGMAAVVAAVMRAPLQAILIIFELTRDYSVIPPLMIGCAVSVKLSELFEPESVFTRGLVRRGERLARGMDFGLIEGLTVADVMAEHYVALPPDAPIRDVREMVRASENRTFPVAGPDGRLRGIVMLAGLIAAAARSNEPGARPPAVRDLVEPDAVHLGPDDSLASAWEKMGNYDYDCLPVCRPGPEGLIIVGICEKEAILERHDRESFARLPAQEER